MATDTDALHTMHIPATGEVKEFNIPDPIAQVLAEDAQARRPHRLSQAERYSTTNPVVICERTGKLQNSAEPVTNSPVAEMRARIAELERCLELSNKAQTKLAKSTQEFRDVLNRQKTKNDRLRCYFHKALDLLVYLQEQGHRSVASDAFIARHTEVKK